MTADLSGSRSLLAGITPGVEWVVNDEEQTVRVKHPDGGMWCGEIIFDRSGDTRTEWAETRKLAAFIAAAPSTVARLLGIVERVEKVRQELFDISNDENWAVEHRAAYRDASRAINTAITGEGEA